MARSRWLRYSFPGITTLLNPMRRSLLGCSEGYTYRGTALQKNPIDLSIYTLLLWDLKPRTVIEIGTCRGGSAMWFADQMEIFGREPNVISVDLEPPRFEWPGVTFVKADATKMNGSFREAPKPWLVIEDSAHDYETTTAVLEHFDPQLEKGDYMVIEDLHKAEASEAVEDWLRCHGDRYSHDKFYRDFWGFTDFAWLKVMR